MSDTATPTTTRTAKAANGKNKAIHVRPAIHKKVAALAKRDDRNITSMAGILIELGITAFNATASPAPPSPSED